MESALGASIGIVAYLALFGGIGLIFVFVNLLVGRFLRPANPSDEKLEIYECGEPTIGSSFVQFDLRFYVVALVFIIFDVEVAFLFPWATVYGKLHHLVTEPVALVQQVDDQLTLTPTARAAYAEMGDLNAVAPQAETSTVAERMLREGVVEGGQMRLAGLDDMLWFSVIAVSFFFVVLLVGFAYEWRTGALDWVRAIAAQSAEPADRSASSLSKSQESVLSA